MAEIGTDIFRAKKLLQHDLVAIPTETVYGLAANALDAKLVARIFEVKQRPFFDPLIVHCATLEQAMGLCKDVDKRLLALAETFWPGPLTLLLPKSEQIPDIVTSGLERVGLRVPAHPLSLELLQSLDFPLAAPSANPFGYVSPTSAAHVQAQLGEFIPYILDGGNCNVGIESTIVGIEDDGIHIYRLGGLAVEDIEKVVGSVRLQQHSSSNPAAPGMLASHYAPKKRLIWGDIPALLEEYRKENPLLIRFSSYLDAYPIENQLLLSLDGTLSAAAISLFAVLRKADEMPHGLILAEQVPDIGLGRAINDRLRRASVRGVIRN